MKPSYRIWFDSGGLFQVNKPEEVNRAMENWLTKKSAEHWAPGSVSKRNVKSSLSREVWKKISCPCSRRLFQG